MALSASRMGLVPRRAVGSAVPCLLPAAPRRPIVKAAAQQAARKRVDDALEQANALLAAVGGAPLSGADAAAVQASVDSLTALGFVCDESGCVLVLPSETEDEGGQALTVMLGGDGWQLGLREKADIRTEDVDYPALASGPDWAAFLSEGELSDLLSVLQQLRAAVARLAAEGQWLPGGGGRPASRAKWQSRNITMQATWAPGGEHAGFSVDLALRMDRRRAFTGSWPAPAVSGLLSAVDAAAGRPAGAGAKA